MNAKTYPYLNTSFLRGSFKGQVDSILKTRVAVLEYALPDDSPEHQKVVNFLDAVDSKDILIPEDTPERTMEKFNWIKTGVKQPLYWDLPKPSAPPAWYETFYAGIQVDPDYNYAKTLEAMRANPETAKAAPKQPKAATTPAKAKEAETKKLGRQKASVDNLLQYPFHTQLEKVSHLSDAHATLWLEHHNAHPELERSALTEKQATNLKYMSRQVNVPLQFTYAIIEA